MSSNFSQQSNRTQASKSGLNLTIDPIEKFILAGLQKKILEVFEAKSVWVTSTDKTKALQKLFGVQAAKTNDANVVYPYTFLTLGSLRKATDRGNNKALSHYGLSTVATVNDQKRAYRAKLVPVDFEVKVEFVTDNVESVLKFTNTWMFAGESGWLAFNVLYGGSTFSVTSVLSDEVNIPNKDSSLSNVQEYTVEVVLTIRGYMSFATLIEQQIVDTVVETGLLVPQADTVQEQLDNSTVIWSFTSSDLRE